MKYTNDQRKFIAEKKIEGHLKNLREPTNHDTSLILIEGQKDRRRQRRRRKEGKEGDRLNRRKERKVK